MKKKNKDDAFRRDDNIGVSMDGFIYLEELILTDKKNIRNFEILEK